MFNITHQLFIASEVNVTKQQIRAENITSHFVGLNHDTTQHNTDSAHHILSHITFR